MGYSESYFAQFKGQNITFKVVTSFPDIKLLKDSSFVDFEDYLG